MKNMNSVQLVDVRKHGDPGVEKQFGGKSLHLNMKFLVCCPPSHCYQAGLKIGQVGEYVPAQKFPVIGPWLLCTVKVKHSSAVTVPAAFQTRDSAGVIHATSSLSHTAHPLHVNLFQNSGETPRNGDGA